MVATVFSVPIFLVVFRETIEAAIVISVLLAFLKQTLDGPNRNITVYKSLVRQVWVGTALGFLLCFIIGGAVIGTFYSVGKNVWDKSEYYYEGAFYLVAAIIITVIGSALLRIGKMQEKWRLKLAKAMEEPVQAGSRRRWLARFAGKYALFSLAFITVSREGIEGVVFISGVSFSAPARAVPLPVVAGLTVGCIIGWIIYKGSSTAKLQIFLVASTCLLYLVAAGLVARSAWYFEQQQWNKMIGKDASERGAGPGSYNIHRSVWHVNCCSPELHGGGGWGVFNGILGWTNSATYSTVISYNLYWLLVVISFLAMRYHEVKGHWPLMRPKNPVESNSGESIEQGNSTSVEVDVAESGVVGGEMATKKITTNVRAVEAGSQD